MRDNCRVLPGRDVGCMGTLGHTITFSLAAFVALTLERIQGPAAGSCDRDGSSVALLLPLKQQI